MRLGEIIEILEKQPKEKICKVGFNKPHSYRGYYEELAFHKATEITVEEMLNSAKEALGSTYNGYKGGEFIMDEHTPVHIAAYGYVGEELGETLLDFMLDEF